MTDEQREFLEVMHTFKRLNFMALMPNINSSDAHLISAIGRHNQMHPDKKMKVSHLVKHLPAPAPAISRGLKVLEKRGLIVRTIDPEDHRNTLVELTDDGKKMCDAINNSMREYFDVVFSKMDKVDLVRLTELMRKMYDIAKEELDLRLEEMKKTGVDK